MKNNILGALVIFFAVVACLLIIDDLSYKGHAQLEYPSQENLVKPEVKSDLATNDSEIQE